MYCTKESKGITLIALVITIVVLLILVGITLSMAIGNNGVLVRSQDAVTKNGEISATEDVEMAYSSVITDFHAESIKNPNLSKRQFINAERLASQVEKNNVGTITDFSRDNSTGIINVDYVPNNRAITYSIQIDENGSSKIIDTSEVPSSENTISKDTSFNEGKGFVGYFADIDGNLSIDGIIFADLLTQNNLSGTWMDDDGNFTITSDVNESNVKDYIISKYPDTDERFDNINIDPSLFTTRYVVRPAKNSSGTKDRFYVMSLEDLKGGDYSYFYCYKNAYGIMNDYSSTTSSLFGKGKQNTANMLAKWNLKAYGDQDDRDFLKYLNIGSGEKNEGWFVPSKEEWLAFLYNYNIDYTNYYNYGLSYAYWTSSQKDRYFVWSPSLYNGSCYMNYLGTHASFGDFSPGMLFLFVRLCTTF